MIKNKSHYHFENYKTFLFNLELIRPQRDQLTKCHCRCIYNNWIYKKKLNTFHSLYYSHHMPVRLKETAKLQRSRLQYAGWLGNSTALLIIADNDIYLRQSPSDEEDIRLTYSGYGDTVYNGVPDWLYQGNSIRRHLRQLSNKTNTNQIIIIIAEEIFSSPEAIWGSPDGSHIMYATFNDTNVGVMTFPWFATGALIAATGISSGSSFPETRTLRYPTPGTTNPEVDLWILDVTNISDPLRWHVKPPSSLDGQ